ncbi:MAG TPA: hypothetical protein DCF78_03995, partial [Dehalococcoidia bacterium]|nr:hypothetical protein [Dehalococcoidia bacterium]
MYDPKLIATTPNRQAALFHPWYMALANLESHKINGKCRKLQIDVSAHLLHWIENATPFTS